MKIKQLITLLADEKDLLSKYLTDPIENINNDKEIGDDLLTEILSESKRKLYISTASHLKPALGGEKDAVIIMTLSEAYQRYGCEALITVMEKGLFNLEKRRQQLSGNIPMINSASSPERKAC